MLHQLLRTQGALLEWGCKRGILVRPHWGHGGTPLIEVALWPLVGTSGSTLDLRLLLELLLALHHEHLLLLL